MTQQQKNTALVFSIVAGLVSLPMTWMIITDAQIQGGMGKMFNSAFGGMTVAVTGLNGHVTFLVKTPIWFIVGIAVSASVLQLMRHSQTFAIPRALEWVAAILAVGWVGVAVLVALTSSQAALGIGSLVGLFSAAAPLACLVIPNPQPDSESQPGNE